MFKRFYDSGWQHPGIAFLGILPFVVAFALRQRFLLGWVALFTFEILIDALFTGSLNPAAHLGIGQQIGITFVILGDYRYFVLVEWVASQGKRADVRDVAQLPGLGPISPWALAVLLAFIVPVASTVPQLALPHMFPSDDPLALHRIFILYEGLFFALGLAMRFVYVPRRLAGADPELVRWIQRVTAFELVQYGLWILADAIILSTRADLAYLLRAVPNTLYYVLFVPFVAYSAPAWLWGGAVRSSRGT